MAETSARTKVLWVAFGVLALAAGTAVLSIGFYGQFGASQKLIWTSITTVIYALLALLGGLILSKRPRMGWWSLVLLGISYMTWMAYVWVEPDWDDQERFMKVIAFFAVLAGVSLQMGLLMLPTIRGGGWRIMRVLAGVCSVGAGLLILLAVYSEGGGSWNSTGSISGVLALLALFGTVMVPVGAAIERSSTEDQQEVDIAQRTPVAIYCPRCKTPATIRANTNGACESCGLRIHVKIDEPRCKCGYLLYDLVSEVCPECGEDIPSELRWHERQSAAISSNPAQSASAARTRTPPQKP